MSDCSRCSTCFETTGVNSLTWVGDSDSSSVGLLSEVGNDFIVNHGGGGIISFTVKFKP